VEKFQSEIYKKKSLDGIQIQPVDRETVIHAEAAKKV